MLATMAPDMVMTVAMEVAAAMAAVEGVVPDRVRWCPRLKPMRWMFMVLLSSPYVTSSVSHRCLHPLRWQPPSRDHFWGEMRKMRSKLAIIRWLSR